VPVRADDGSGVVPQPAKLRPARAKLAASQDVDIVKPANSGCPARLIDRLRTAGATLSYDPGWETTRVGDSDPVAVTVSRDSG